MARRRSRTKRESSSAHHVSLAVITSSNVTEMLKPSTKDCLCSCVHPRRLVERVGEPESGAISVWFSFFIHVSPFPNFAPPSKHKPERRGTEIIRLDTFAGPAAPEHKHCKLVVRSFDCVKSQTKIRTAFRGTYMTCCLLIVRGGVGERTNSESEMGGAGGLGCYGYTSRVGCDGWQHACSFVSDASLAEIVVSVEERRHDTIS